MAFWWAFEFFTCYYSRKDHGISQWNQPTLSVDCPNNQFCSINVWNQRTTWNFPLSAPVALFFPWDLLGTPAHLTREGNTEWTCMSFCTSLMLFFFLGEIPRCESMGQRVLHVVKSFCMILLKLPLRNLASLPSQKLYIITCIIPLVTSQLAAKLKKKRMVCSLFIQTAMCFQLKT